jgi:hypothetical protein
MKDVEIQHAGDIAAKVRYGGKQSVALDKSRQRNDVFNRPPGGRAWSLWSRCYSFLLFLLYGGWTTHPGLTFEDDNGDGIGSLGVPTHSFLWSGPAHCVRALVHHIIAQLLSLSPSLSQSAEGAWMGGGRTSWRQLSGVVSFE